MISNGSLVRVVSVSEKLVTHEIKVPMTEILCFAEWQGMVACGCSDG